MHIPEAVDALERDFRGIFGSRGERLFAPDLDDVERFVAYIDAWKT